MDRIILRKNVFVIQEKFLFWWVDKTAQDDFGNDLPCIYAFDTLDEAIYYSPDAFISAKSLSDKKFKKGIRQLWKKNKLC